jgi:hypothetical protein
MPCCGAGSSPNDCWGRSSPNPKTSRGSSPLCSHRSTHGFWSLGMRTKSSTYADVKEAFDQGRILRTHMLRTTWHFVTPEDIRWILAATSPRVLTVFGSHFRSLGLDERTQQETAEQVVKMLEGRNHLTRREIGAELERQGVTLGGERLTYIVMGAELRGLICSGPMRGAQHTYAVLDERVPPGCTYDNDEAKPELAFRFFKGHGPASLTDFTRWSSLTLTEAREAIEAAAARLDSIEVDEQKLWFDPTTQTEIGSDHRTPSAPLRRSLADLPEAELRDSNRSSASTRHAAVHRQHHRRRAQRRHLATHDHQQGPHDRDRPRERSR